MVFFWGANKVIYIVLAQCLTHSEHTRNVSGYGVDGGGRSGATQAWLTTSEITTGKKVSRITPIAAVQGSGNQNKKAGPANYISKHKKLEIEHWNDAAKNEFTFNDLVCQKKKTSLKGDRKMIFASVLPCGSHVSSPIQRIWVCIQNASCKRVWKMLLNFQPFKCRKIN